MSVTVLTGDCLDLMREMPEASVDAVVTDPPYHLTSIVRRFGAPDAAPAKGGVYARSSRGFMGQTWDGGDVAFRPETWAEVLRVLKPGGHLIAFGGTRTFHRLVCAVEDAGFEVRDMLAWLYGQGFPKSLNVGKALDKRRDDAADIVRVTAWLAAEAAARGVTRPAIDAHMGTNGMAGHWTSTKTQAAVPMWDQWLALKAFIGFGDDMDAEVWRLNGRKGLPGEAWGEREVVGRALDGAGNGSVVGMGSARSMETEYDITAPATALARQWEGWGTSLKPSQEPITLARKPLASTVAANVAEHGTGALNIDGCRISASGENFARPATHAGEHEGWDRPWKHTEEGKARRQVSKDAAADKASGVGRWPANVLHDGSPEVLVGFPESKSGGVTHQPRRSGYGFSEGRDNGTHIQREPDTGSAARFFFCAKASPAERGAANGHPTVKPLTLMRYLVRLVTPPGGVVLDPFAGSGTTGLAAMQEGMRAILCEQSADYAAIIRDRLAAEAATAPLLGWTEAAE